MIQLDDIIFQATASIDAGYFHLATAGGGLVTRERVYCYELYHQMRSIWPADVDLTLSGEVDKAGHEVLRRLGMRAAIPDLLVHQPGFMERNHAIIEVKPACARKEGIRKDIATLSEFRISAGYERAIYLFYGGVDIDAVQAIADEYDGLAPIELWVHIAPGQTAEHICEIS